MINSSAINTQTDSYTDLANLNSITQLGKKDQGQALEKVAEQFESMMVRMMMKSMRSANEVFAEGNYLSSNAGDMYQDMFDDQLALTLSQGRGMGIADVMVRQLKQRFGTEQSETQEVSNKNPLQRSNVSTHYVPTIAVAKNGSIESTPVSIAPKISIQTAEINFDGSSEKFFNQLYGMAEKAAKKLGVKPEVLISQAALETGWGKKITSLGNTSSFNLFNIKADSRWQGSTITVPTIEVRQGVAVRETAVFRAYDSFQKSFDDYVDFVSSSPRYEKALQVTNDSEDYVRELAQAGYATDPKYSEKILAILNSGNIKNSVASVTKTSDFAAPQGY